MLNRILISKELITGIDVLNTLNGGVIEASIKFSQFPEYHQIDVKAPGIREDGLHVKVENYKLVIFYQRDIESQGKTIPVPHVVYNEAIPFFIDAPNISAQYVDNTLVVQLPFNELADGYHRDIPIES